MSKLKALSVKDLLSIFGNFGFTVFSQKGSHMKLRRISAGGVNQTLTIPNHKELAKGTLISIHRQALQYIPENELQSHFYFG